eukprot:scaffold211163_cov30-Tisochrysis_lutea.AAC.5
MAATPLVLDALVLEHLSERFPEAAQALRKELEIKQAELPQPALVAAQQRQALLTLLSSKRAGEPMWAAAYAELRDWIDGAIDVYKVRARHTAIHAAALPLSCLPSPSCSAAGAAAGALPALRIHVSGAASGGGASPRGRLLRALPLGSCPGASP